MSLSVLLRERNVHTESQIISRVGLDTLHLTTVGFVGAALQSLHVLPDSLKPPPVEGFTAVDDHRQFRARLRQASTMKTRFIWTFCAFCLCYSVTGDFQETWGEQAASAAFTRV